MIETLSTHIEETQPVLYRQLHNTFKHRRINHSYIIQGNELDEQLNIVKWLCQGLVCEQSGKDNTPCGECRSCQLVQNQEYADIMILEPEGLSIKVDQIREMQSFFTSGGIESRSKILWVKESEKLTPQSANSLLKFIEEPDGEFYIFFLTRNSRLLLPTIQSRCQWIKIQDYSKTMIFENIQEKQSNLRLTTIVSQYANSVEEAEVLLETPSFLEAIDLLEKWLKYLIKGDPNSFVFVQQHLVKQAKEKKEQHILLELLIVLIQLKLKEESLTPFSNPENYVKMLLNVTEAKQKLSHNVSFQNVCEQLAWRTMASS